MGITEDSPLIEALKNNQADIVRGMIENGTDINESFNNLTPLLYAITQKCSLRVVQLLLDHGADASYRRRDGITPLFAACSVKTSTVKCYRLCSLLLEKGADCNLRTHVDGPTPFLRALQMQTLRVVKLLLDHGADINAVVGERGWTALHCAAQNPHVDVLDYILDLGRFDVESRDGHGYSALFWAALHDNAEACEFLLKRGALVNKMNIASVKVDPIAWKIHFGAKYTSQSAEIVQLFLEYGADVPEMALRIAASVRGRDDIRNALMRHMAKLEYLNLSVKESLRQIIQSKDCYKGYYQACLQELDNMKATKVYDNVSILNILMDSNNLISRYARNTMLVKALEDVDYNAKFPIYFAWLKKRFYAKVDRQSSQNTAALIVSKIFSFNSPVHLVNRNIVRYFNDSDLKFFGSNVFPIELSH